MKNPLINNNKRRTRIINSNIHRGFLISPDSQYFKDRFSVNIKIQWQRILHISHRFSTYFLFWYHELVNWWIKMQDLPKRLLCGPFALVTETKNLKNYHTLKVFWTQNIKYGSSFSKRLLWGPVATVTEAKN